MDNIEYKSEFYLSPHDITAIEKYKTTKLPAILSKVQDEKTRAKITEIFYNGKCGEYSLTGTSSKDNALLEFERRKSLIELAENSPEAFKQIIENNINLFHGTNFNALPGIIKNGGMLSEDNLHKSNNQVLTGEEWTRNLYTDRKRDFISFTDQLDCALDYAAISPSEEATHDSFGILIGISLEDLKDLRTYKIHSDIPELGISNKLPISKIKVVFVPNERLEFVSKILHDTGISTVSLDTLEPIIDKTKYGKLNLKQLTETRKTSGIKSIFSRVKETLKTKFSDKDITNENGEEFYERN